MNLSDKKIKFDTIILAASIMGLNSDDYNFNLGEDTDFYEEHEFDEIEPELKNEVKKASRNKADFIMTTDLFTIKGWEIYIGLYYIELSKNGKKEKFIIHL